MILINATLLLVHFFIISKLYVCCMCTCVCVCVCVYVLYELFFFIDNVVHLLSDVNVCHAFYNKLTYLLT